MFKNLVIARGGLGGIDFHDAWIGKDVGFLCRRAQGLVVVVVMWCTVIERGGCRTVNKGPATFFVELCHGATCVTNAVFGLTTLELVVQLLTFVGSGCCCLISRR